MGGGSEEAEIAEDPIEVEKYEDNLPGGWRARVKSTKRIEGDRIEIDNESVRRYDSDGTYLALDERELTAVKDGEKYSLIINVIAKGTWEVRGKEIFERREKAAVFEVDYALNGSKESLTAEQFFAELGFGRREISTAVTGTEALVVEVMTENSFRLVEKEILENKVNINFRRLPNADDTRRLLRFEREHLDALPSDPFGEASDPFADP